MGEEVSFEQRPGVWKERLRKEGEGNHGTC